MIRLVGVRRGPLTPRFSAGAAGAKGTGGQGPLPAHDVEVRMEALIAELRAARDQLVATLAEGLPQAAADQALARMDKMLGVGESWCNCQAIPGTVNYPGPWHPTGDTPGC